MSSGTARSARENMRKPGYYIINRVCYKQISPITA